MALLNTAFKRALRNTQPDEPLPIIVFLQPGAFNDFAQLLQQIYNGAGVEITGRSQGLNFVTLDLTPEQVFALAGTESDTIRNIAVDAELKAIEPVDQKPFIPPGNGD